MPLQSNFISLNIYFIFLQCSTAFPFTNFLAVLSQHLIYCFGIIKWSYKTLSLYSKQYIESSYCPFFLIILRYILYWRKRFTEQPITDFCSVIRINSTAPLGKYTSQLPYFPYNPKIQMNNLTFLNQNSLTFMIAKIKLLCLCCLTSIKLNRTIYQRRDPNGHTYMCFLKE